MEVAEKFLNGIYCLGRATCTVHPISAYTESEIDVGQGINVGPGIFFKKNKRGP